MSLEGVPGLTMVEETTCSSGAPAIPEVACTNLVEEGVTTMLTECLVEGIAAASEILGAAANPIMVGMAAIVITEGTTTRGVLSPESSIMMTTIGTVQL